MISWSDWPARRRPLVSLFAALAIALVVAIVASMDPWLALLGGLLLLGLCAEALLPTRFTVTQQGVQVDSMFRKGLKPWQNIASWQPAEQGFLLRGGRRAGSLRYRDLWLRCPDHSVHVEEQLRDYLGAPVGGQK